MDYRYHMCSYIWIYGLIVLSVWVYGLKPQKLDRKKDQGSIGL